MSNITIKGLKKLGFEKYEDYDIIGSCYRYPKLPLRFYSRTLHFGALDESSEVKTIEGVKLVIKAFKLIEGIK